MSNQRFASTPQPPYYAVIFTSLRSSVDDAYGLTAERMAELAGQQPGYLGVESVRDESGVGITVSYWQSEEAILAWKREMEHSAARQKGRDSWYLHYEVRVAKVERAYRWSHKDTDR